MKLKLPSLAAAFGTTSASANSSENNNLLRHDEKLTHRDLQGLPASIVCLVGGGGADCCSTDPAADGVCTLLTCVDITPDSVAANEACSCSQIDTACESVATIGAAVPGLLDMCGQVKTCCNSGAASVTEFNGCIGETTNIPNFAAFLPGGVPDLCDLRPIVGENWTGDMVACTTDATTTDATVAGSSGDPCTICAGVTVDDTQTMGESGMTCAQIIANTEGIGCILALEEKEAIEMGCCPATGDATTVAATQPAITDATQPAVTTTVSATTTVSVTTTVSATEPPPAGAGSKYGVEAFMYVMGTLVAMVLV